MEGGETEEVGETVDGFGRRREGKSVVLAGSFGNGVRAGSGCLRVEGEGGGTERGKVDVAGWR